MSEQEREQNKKINQLNRRVSRLERTVNTLNLDLEPDGRISEAFEQIENHLDEQDKRFDKLSHDMNQVKASLNYIVEHLTGISDLPEE